MIEYEYGTARITLVVGLTFRNILYAPDNMLFEMFIRVACYFIKI